MTTTRRIKAGMGAALFALAAILFFLVFVMALPGTRDAVPAHAANVAVAYVVATLALATTIGCAVASGVLISAGAPAYEFHDWRLTLLAFFIRVGGAGITFAVIGANLAGIVPDAIRNEIPPTGLPIAASLGFFLCAGAVAIALVSQWYRFPILSLLSDHPKETRQSASTQ